MELVINNKTFFRLDKKKIEEITELILNQELGNNCFIIALEIVSDSTIKSLNKRYFGKNDYTDVLTFRSDDDLTNILGDIIIDINHIEKKKGSTLDFSDFLIVYIHALLHLLGYDHLNSKSEKEMVKKEEKYQKFLKEFVV